jgi:predicted small secreted protein
MFKKHTVLFAALLALVVSALTGCNTIKGVGQDIQKAGEVLEDAATKKK